MTVTRNIKAFDGSGWTTEGSASPLPPGMVVPFAGASAPSGWLLCYGQTVNRADYPLLFTAIGTTYNTGGEAGTVFRLPDLRGRTIAGKDNMGGSAANRITSAGSGINGTTLGDKGGSEATQQHSHTFTGSAVTSGGGSQHSHTFTGSAVNSGWAGAHTHTTTIYYAGFYAPQWDTGQTTWNRPYLWNAYPGNPSTGLGSSDPGNHQHSVTAAGTNSNESSHTHSVTAAGTNANYGTGSSGNVQPTLILNYIIKV